MKSNTKTFTFPKTARVRGFAKGCGNEKVIAEQRENRARKGDPHTGFGVVRTKTAGEKDASPQAAPGTDCRIAADVPEHRFF